MQQQTYDKRTVTRTIRMDREVDFMLVNMSAHDRISVNQIVNTALHRHTEWETYANTMGMVELNKHTVMKLFDSIPMKRVRELGYETGVNTWQEMVTILFKTVNYESIVKMLELRGHYGHWFIFDRSERNSDIDVLLLKHNQGAKLTAFFAEAVKALLSIANVKYEVEEEEDQLIVTVQLNRRRNIDHLNS